MDKKDKLIRDLTESLEDYITVMDSDEVCLLYTSPSPRDS